MRPADMEPFGGYLVFVDESGDHGLASVDPNYPVFVLDFCVFKKSDYTEAMCPALQRLKFTFWGHDEVVMHEKEDNQLELAFRRICDGSNALGQRLPFGLVMIPKAANSCGLQVADLVARPIGIKVLRPTQANRAFDIVETKFRRSPAGEVKGCRLKVFP